MYITLASRLWYSCSLNESNLISCIRTPYCYSINYNSSYSIHSNSSYSIHSNVKRWDPKHDNARTALPTSAPETREKYVYML